MLAVFTVTNLNDAPVNTPAAVGTLRQAIFDANATPFDADIIEFASALAGTVNLGVADSQAEGGSALLVSSPITIRGNANGITIARDAGAPEMRVFHVTTTGELTLETVMLTGGLTRGTNGATPGQSGGGASGGGILNDGTLTIVGSTLYGNSAIGGNGLNGPSGTGLGGAVANRNGTVTIKNSTISMNSVVSGSGTAIRSSFGGGVYSVNGYLAIHNSTLTLNVASTGRQLFVIGQNGTAIFEFRSSIATAGDSTGQSRDVLAHADTDGQIQVTGSKIIVGTHIGLEEIDHLTDDPQLGPLADNGGPTWTHAIAGTSPALNNGENTLELASDQRGAGFARVVNGTADIGAFELQPAAGLRGDYNASGRVDAADYVVWRKLLGAEVTPFDGPDGDGSGEIDPLDYDVWYQEFGSVTSAGGGSIGVSGESFMMTSAARLDRPQAMHVQNAIVAPSPLVAGGSLREVEVDGKAGSQLARASQPALLRLIEATHQANPILKRASSSVSDIHWHGHDDELAFINADDLAWQSFDGNAIDIDTVWDHI